MENVIINDLSNLKRVISEEDPEIIIVEGYNGVGKSRVLDYLQNLLDIRAYRPNYLGWFKRVPRNSRWIASLAFLDILKSQKFSLGHKLLLDRGFLSGPVYNNDMELAIEYREVIEDMKILHILVTCSRESYEKFCEIRDSSKLLSYDECLKYTERYKIALQLSGLSYVEFINMYDESLGDAARTCRGCSHYNVGDSWCKHPKINKQVPRDQERCEYSRDLEVQDIERLLQLQS